jgi:chitinase
MPGNNLLASASTIALLLTLVLGPSTASAGPRDRTPPTTPTDLRVTGTTPYSVSLAWNPSTDNSGSFTYRICCAYSNSASVSPPATSFTFTAGIEAGRSFTFRVYAVDAAGNASGYSNSVSMTTPPDTIPPSKPIASVTEVGPTHVSLAWSSVEEGPHVWFWVFKDGSPIMQGTAATSGTISLLEPETTYTFTVQAKDFAANVSPLSDPVAATTESRNTSDTTPPTTPANLTDNGMNFGEEIWLFWEQSTDDVTPQSLIAYEVYANGVLNHTVVGRDRTVLYGTPGIVNTFQVIAVDEAGNKSSPANWTADMR